MKKIAIGRSNRSSGESSNSTMVWRSASSNNGPRMNAMMKATSE